MDQEIFYAFLRMLIILPLVAGLAYLVIKYGLARRWNPAGVAKRRHSAIKVIEQVPLGSKGLLSLIEIGGKYYLLAHSETSFELIKEFETPPIDLEQNDVLDKQKSMKIIDFAKILKLKFKKPSK
ncbi:MAG: flagellar biosynthetic protein FliO [Desulfotomaculum sp.]|nr:flagellar biosynthetic protein FliO [Desulfotomaculum sp.]